jgi:hypothetical protein
MIEVLQMPDHSNTWQKIDLFSLTDQTFRFEKQYIEPSSVQLTYLKNSRKELAADWPLFTKTLKRRGLPTRDCSMALLINQNNITF